MHILIIHQVSIASDEAGSTRHFELAKYLVKKGHKVSIVCGAVNYLTGEVECKFRSNFLHREEIEGVEVIRTWTYSKIHNSYISRLGSFISFMFSSVIGGFSAGRIDVVIACSPQIFTGVSGYFLSKIKKIPFIFEIRDLWPKFAIETEVLKNPRLIFWAESLEKWIYKRADFFIINSPGFYKHLEKFGIRREKVFLIPNGADTAFFKPSKRYNLVREELGLGENFVVMYAGAHGRANGLDTVIESAKLLRDYDDIVFMLVGDGKEKKRLAELADEYGLKNILFVNAKPKKKMPELCSTADICLAILQKKESFKTVYPNKLFDYMASGRSTVLAIDGVARELLEKANAGVFVDPENPKALAEAVLNMYTNRTLLEEYGMNARKFVVKYFAREKIAEKLHKILTKIIKEDNLR